MKTTFYVSKRVKIEGIDVGVFANKAEADLLRAKVKSALVLLRTYDPRRFAYLRRDMKRILVFGAPNFNGCWHPGFALCQLTDSYVLMPETTPAMVASTLAHEAMHGRLYRWGFGYEEDRRVRIERICFRASIAFARRLPDTERASREQIIATGLQQIQRNPTFWTDEGSLAARLEALQEMGCSPWLLALFRRIGQVELRWKQWSRRRSSSR